MRAFSMQSMEFVAASYLSEMSTVINEHKRG
jgi:hypothetical protein